MKFEFNKVEDNVFSLVMETDYFFISGQSNISALYDALILLRKDTSIRKDKVMLTMIEAALDLFDDILGLAIR